MKAITMDDLLHYYNNELEYLRKQGHVFAQQHPQVAAHLGLTEGRVEDPHISRLLEGVAFLTARVKAHIDNDYPQLTESLMDTLYPDFRAPIPSQTVIKATLTNTISHALTFSAGTEMLLKDKEHTCVFRMKDDVRILPIELKNLTWQSLPAIAPELAAEYKAVFSMEVIPNEMADISMLSDHALRLYVSSQGQLGFKLHEALLRESAGVAIECRETGKLIYLPPSALNHYGFARDTAFSAHDVRTSSAHQQLTDFFTFYQQFMFVELQGLIDEKKNINVWNDFKNGFKIYIYCQFDHEMLASHIDDNCLSLGCVPAINLFEEGFQSISADRLGHEIKIEPKGMYSPSTDIQKILKIKISNQFGQEQPVLPYYSVHERDHDTYIDGVRETLYWTSRKEAKKNAYDPTDTFEPGMNTYLSIVDDACSVVGSQKGFHINGKALCTNRNTPNQLEFSSEYPQVDMIRTSHCAVFKVLEKPTPWRLPQKSHASRWQFVNALTLQSFANSTKENSSGLQVLKDILRLYSPGDHLQNKLSESYIKGLVKLELKPATTFIRQQGKMALCRGTEINLTCDEYYWSQNRVYLFGTLLNHFFSSLAGMNTFTQLNIYNQQESEAIIQWKPITGQQDLL